MLLTERFELRLSKETKKTLKKLSTIYSRMFKRKFSIGEVIRLGIQEIKSRNYKELN